MNCRYCGQFDSVSLGDGIWSCNVCGKTAIEPDCDSCGDECHMDCEEMRGRPAIGPLAKALDTIDSLHADKAELLELLEEMAAALERSIKHAYDEDWDMGSCGIECLGAMEAALQKYRERNG